MEPDDDLVRSHDFTRLDDDDRFSDNDFICISSSSSSNSTPQERN
jgi:hypothetical protein